MMIIGNSFFNVAFLFSPANVITVCSFMECILNGRLINYCNIYGNSKFAKLFPLLIASI